MKTYATADEILGVLAAAGGCVPSDCSGQNCTCRIQAQAMFTSFRVGRRAPEPIRPSHRPYSDAELAVIGSMVLDGARCQEIAERVGRTQGAIYAKTRRFADIWKTSLRKKRNEELTQRQKQALDVIKAFWAEHGYAPSYEVIARGLNIRSKSGVSRILDSLIASGYVTKQPRRARSVRPVELGPT